MNKCREMNSLTIHDAIAFAALAHRNQLRKGTTIPYIVHPMEVMQILTDNGCSEDVIVAGILHDTLEDTTTTPNDIASRFGSHVLSLVSANSEDKSKSWQERKRHTLNWLRNADLEQQMVCCADKLSNARSIYADWLTIGDDVFLRFNAPKEDVRWYYQGIVSSLDKLDGYKMKRELQEVVDAIFPVS